MLPEEEEAGYTVVPFEGVCQPMPSSILSPMFRLEMLPEEECQSAWNLQNSIGRLSSYVAAFEAAVALYDHTLALLKTDRSNRQYWRWCHIAAREGAMTVYHFGCVLLNGCSFKPCPSLGSLVSASHMKLARKRFAAKFPNATALRNIIAHDAEAYDTEEKRGIHALRSKGATATKGTGLVIHSGLVDRSFQTTFEGRIISYDLDEKTLRFLQEITIQFYQSLERVERLSPQLRQRIALDREVRSQEP